MRLRALAFAALMAGMAVLLQNGPLWLGEPAGYGLSIWASLPLAVAAAQVPREAALAGVTTVILCLFINPQEALIFGLTNGLLGLVIGMALNARLSLWRSVLLAGAALFAGMALLTWGIGLAALGESVLAGGLPFALGAYAAFALIWATLFTTLARALCRRVLGALPRPTEQQRASRP